MGVGIIVAVGGFVRGAVVGPGGSDRSVGVSVGVEVDVAVDVGVGVGVDAKGVRLSSQEIISSNSSLYSAWSIAF